MLGLRLLHHVGRLALTAGQSLSALRSVRFGQAVIPRIPVIGCAAIPRINRMQHTTSDALLHHALRARFGEHQNDSTHTIRRPRVSARDERRRPANDPWLVRRVVPRPAARAVAPSCSGGMPGPAGQAGAEAPSGGTIQVRWRIPLPSRLAGLVPANTWALYPRAKPEREATQFSQTAGADSAWIHACTGHASVSDISSLQHLTGAPVTMLTVTERHEVRMALYKRSRLRVALELRSARSTGPS